MQSGRQLPYPTLMGRGAAEELSMIHKPEALGKVTGMVGGEGHGHAVAKGGGGDDGPWAVTAKRNQKARVEVQQALDSTTAADGLSSSGSVATVGMCDDAACDDAAKQQLQKELVDLIELMDVLNFVELKMATECPGFGGRVIKRDTAVLARKIELTHDALCA